MIVDKGKAALDKQRCLLAQRQVPMNQKTGSNCNGAVQAGLLIPSLARTQPAHPSIGECPACGLCLDSPNEPESQRHRAAHDSGAPEPSDEKDNAASILRKHPSEQIA